MNLHFLRHEPYLRRFLHDGIDNHSHLLPGVDDGIHSLREGLRLIDAMQRQGLSACVCTPHINRHYPNNTPVSLRTMFQNFQRQAAVQHPEFRLYLSAEYMLDESFAALSAKGDWLYHDPGGCGSRRLLIELPYTPEDGWADTLAELVQHGIQPLLAHPERSHEHLRLPDIQHLHRLGVRYQGNIASLAGAYGSRARKQCLQIMQLGLYSCWGTDTHSLSQFNRLRHPP